MAYYKIYRIYLKEHSTSSGTLLIRHTYVSVPSCDHMEQHSVFNVFASGVLTSTSSWFINVRLSSLVLFPRRCCHGDSCQRAVSCHSLSVFLSFQWLIKLLARPDDNILGFDIKPLVTLVHRPEDRQRGDSTVDYNSWHPNQRRRKLEVNSLF